MLSSLKFWAEESVMENAFIWVKEFGRWKVGAVLHFENLKNVFKLKEFYLKLGRGETVFSFHTLKGLQEFREYQRMLHVKRWKILKDLRWCSKKQTWIVSTKLFTLVRILDLRFEIFQVSCSSRLILKAENLIFSILVKSFNVSSFGWKLGASFRIKWLFHCSVGHRMYSVIVKDRCNGVSQI